MSVEVNLCADRRPHLRGRWQLHDAQSSKSRELSLTVSGKCTVDEARVFVLVVLKVQDHLDAGKLRRRPYASDRRSMLLTITNHKYIVTSRS